MLNLSSVIDIKKGDKIFVKDITTMWDTDKEEFYDHCFEYVFEVIRNNQKTLGCKYINGPHKGSGFNWIKGYDLSQHKKEYYLIQNNEEIVEKNYRL